MAERVAWRCSFPGCGVITIGPKMGDNTKSLNLGEAAHIHAASPNGPRYDENMTREERKSINNGIWLCRAHATFIDSDYKEYSDKTIRLWKLQAEKSAYENLRNQEKYEFQDDRTLVSFGFNLILLCRWKSVQENEWKFEVDSYLKGDGVKLKEFASNFSSIKNEQKFVVVESQGDARKIGIPIKLEYNKERKTTITVNVEDRHISTDPNKAGMDAAIGLDGDISWEDGDLKMVTGLDAAIQHLTFSTSTVYGSWWGDPTMGSFVSEYYWDFKDDLNLLSRLFKIEFIRLSLISTSDDPNDIDFMPTLHFIKRFNDVTINSSQLIDSKIQVELSLEWGNGEIWKNTIPVWINEI